MEKTYHPMTGEPIWYLYSRNIDDVRAFTDENHHDEFTLSIYDNITSNTMEIECSADDIPEILDQVSAIEDSDIDFIGSNSLCDCYCAGINFNNRVHPVQIIHH